MPWQKSLKAEIPSVPGAIAGRNGEIGTDL
jgi:hypothetical protein